MYLQAGQQESRVVLCRQCLLEVQLHLLLLINLYDQLHPSSQHDLRTAVNILITVCCN